MDDQQNIIIYRTADGRSSEDIRMLEDLEKSIIENKQNGKE